MALYIVLRWQENVLLRSSRAQSIVSSEALPLLLGCLWICIPRWGQELSFPTQLWTSDPRQCSQLALFLEDRNRHIKRVTLAEG